MPATDPHDRLDSEIDWESFYANYRKPGYIAGYEILHKLGGGSFGIVFKARKQSIGKDYAIKFLKVDDAAVRDAVLHELETVRLFAQIDHPNLVTIEDKGQVDGIPYIVMGYAGEETLARRLAGGPLPRAQALALFVQICRGVHALHERMLVHFDLKPANVYLRDEIARIGDYGLSKLVTASRRSLSFGRGTTYYMAPEVLQRRGDHRSDIYSLGVLLYESLVGHVPFRGETEWEVLKKHETALPHYPPSLAPADRALLEACLAKDPAARAQSVRALLAMVHAPDLPPPTASPPAAPAAAPRAGRRVVPLLAGALLAVLALAAWYDARSAQRVRALAFGPAHAELARQAALAERDRAAAAHAARTVSPAPLPPVPPPATSRELILAAFLETLRHFDPDALEGRAPLAEALAEAVKASLRHQQVRDSWRRAMESMLAAPPERRR